jgi:hypothetical protein
VCGMPVRTNSQSNHLAGDPEAPFGVKWNGRVLAGSGRKASGVELGVRTSAMKVVGDGGQLKRGR